MSEHARDHFDMEIFSPFVKGLMASLTKTHHGSKIKSRAADTNEGRGLIYTTGDKVSLVEQMRAHTHHHRHG